MTTLLIALGLVVVLLVAGLAFYAGRKSVEPTGVPTPPSANAVALDTIEDADAAARAADDNAKKKADEVMHAPDDVVRSRVARLRARGRAGE